MRPTLRLSFLAVLVQCILASGNPSNSTHHISATETLNNFECRCGDSTFLELPHANLTVREKAIQCSQTTVNIFNVDLYDEIVLTLSYVDRV